MNFNRIIFFAVVLLTMCSCNKNDEAKGDNNADVNIDLSCWMKKLNDGTRVCKVSIPGTHDALTSEGFTDEKYIDDYTTQVAGFDEQLENGLRYFDIRLVMTGEGDGVRLQTSHRTATIVLTFDDVLNKLKSFLGKNSSEFVIMKIQYDGGAMTETEKALWSNAVQKTLQAENNKSLFVNFRPDITVGEMRGKVLLISRTAYGEPICGALTQWDDEGAEGYNTFDSNTERTLVLAPCLEAAVTHKGGEHANAAKLYVQDYYNTIGDRMDEKLRAVGAMYNSAISVPENENVWIINHLSGFSTPKMNALGYAENASKTNALLLSLLKADTTHKGVGIIAMDYACIDTLNKEIGTLGVINRNVMSASVTTEIIKNNY